MTFSDVFNYCPYNGLAGGTGKYSTCLKSQIATHFGKNLTLLGRDGKKRRGPKYELI